jgi:hypothetical protein
MEREWVERGWEGLGNKGIIGRIGRGDNVMKRRVKAESVNSLDLTKPLHYSLLSR